MSRERERCMSLTESEMMDRVRARFPKGKGWATFRGIRNHRGFAHPKGEKTRTLDGMSVGLWQSHKAEVLGFECKSTRSDFLKEMASPGKSDAFYPHCNRFWLVIGSADVASPDEVPMGWGLLVPRGTSLVEKRKATRKKTEGLPIGIMLSMLAASVDGEEAMLARARADERAKAHDELESGAMLESKLSKLKLEVARLERELKWAENRRDMAETKQEAAQKALTDVVGAGIRAEDIVTAHLLHQRLSSWNGGLRDIEYVSKQLDPLKEALAKVVEVLRGPG